ncbi:hypothetical protein [Nocardia vinacea]|uniref:hypothetical protein n=1 Tax=Nocardia vinacea TaxID=96468 RepID=UPI000688EDBB|nr:hypothetical protein [Nocardia vinacea]
MFQAVDDAGGRARRQVVSRRAEVETRIQVGLRRLVANSVLTNERIAKQVGLHSQDLQALNVITLSEEPMSPGDVSTATGSHLSPVFPLWK